VPRLDVLRRSGRLGAMRRAVAGKLDRYLIMVLDKGGIRDTDVAHGMGATVRALVRQVPEGARKGLLVVSSYGDSAAADALVDCVHRMLPKATVEKRDGGPVVSLHLGVGSVSLAWDVPEGAK
jgi:fatty acid-binding protein DegV